MTSVRVEAIAGSQSGWPGRWGTAGRRGSAPPPEAVSGRSPWSSLGSWGSAYDDGDDDARGDDGDDDDVSFAFRVKRTSLSSSKPLWYHTSHPPRTLSASAAYSHSRTQPRR